jgi:hypothetical protein
MKKTLTLLLFIFCIVFSCERDDICDEDTPTTPHLIIEFRDVTLTDNQKNVTGLRVEDFDDATHVLSSYNDVTEDQIILPLKTDEGITKYRVYRDYNVLSDGTIEGNPDIISVEYGTNELYVSRACGYKTVFKNVEIIIEPDADNWMDFAAPENDNQSVINEDEIHFTIRH